MQARQTKATSESKGVAEEHSSFLNCYLDEAKTAAYLRFSNLGDFRRMKLSYPVIQAFLQLRKNRFGWAKKVLQNIRDTKSLGEEFPPGVDPAAHYPVDEGTLEDESECQTNEHNKTMQCTMVIVELVRSLQAWDHVKLAEKKVQQATIVQQFETATGLTFPSDIYQVVKVPAATLTADKDIGEHELETHNRAIQLLKNMARTCRPEVWGPAYGPARKSKTPLRRTDCRKSAPLWMADDVADAVPKVKASQSLHRCKATALSKSKNGKELGTHMDEVDDDENPVKTEAGLSRLPDFQERYNMYQDALSVLDQCKKYQMCPNRMSVVPKDGDHASPHHFDDSDTPWPKLFTDYIDKRPGPFSLIFRMGRAEEDTSILESIVPPQQLETVAPTIINKLTASINVQQDDHGQDEKTSALMKNIRSLGYHIDLDEPSFQHRPAQKITTSSTIAQNEKNVQETSTTKMATGRQRVSKEQLPVLHILPLQLPRFEDQRPGSTRRS